MQSDLDKLKISEAELEKLSGLEINDVFMGNVCRPSTIKSPKKLLSFSLSQFLLFGLVCIFVLPIGFIVARNFISLAGDAYGIFELLKINLGISLSIVIAWNFYTWLKGKSMASLASLLDEVDKYNEVVDAVKLSNQLAAVSNPEINLVDSEVTEALHVTRDSLVSALVIERILRDNKGFMARRHQLLTNIENNLITLKALEINHQASQYGQLLNEALSIGISVQQEVRKLQS